MCCKVFFSQHKQTVLYNMFVLMNYFTQVNGVYENMPFSQNNVTVQQKNGWITIQTPQPVELKSTFWSRSLTFITRQPVVFVGTTMLIPYLTCSFPVAPWSLILTSLGHHGSLFGDWIILQRHVCQFCQYPVPEYNSDLYCGLLNHPRGQFYACHHLVYPQEYYSLCMENLCVAEGQHWASEAGGMVDLWMNATGCSKSNSLVNCFKMIKCSKIVLNNTAMCFILQMIDVLKATTASVPILAPHCVLRLACQCSAPGAIRKVASVILDSFNDGHNCVPAEQCGCLHDGRRFKVRMKHCFLSILIRNVNLASPTLLLELYHFCL